MIPQKLSLRNFMCYREADLDFSGIQVACLAGENGAGKSALLDAMTWAIWGNSRLGARRDDELIRLGEDEMEVQFSFDLGGDTFRVLRQRKAGGRSRTVLDFQVRDDGAWRSLAEGGVRATQTRIEEVLRLDYDTFINSAFLRQGRADEFTVKTAAERKRVLGEILALDRWSVYEDRVKERLRELETDFATVERRLQEIDAELERRDEYEAQLEEAKADVEALSEAVEAAQAAFREMDRARSELSSTESQIVDVDQRIGRLNDEIAARDKERTAQEERLAEVEGLLAQADAIAAGYAAYQEAVERERELGAKLQQSVELNERRVELESQISKAQHRLETERDAVLKRMEELEGRVPDDLLFEEIDDVRAQIAHLEQLAESRNAARDDLARIAERQAELRARNEALRTEMNALKERIALLEEADAHCPLCEQPLTEDHRLNLLEEFKEKGTAKGDTYRENKALVATLEEQAEALQLQIEGSDEFLRDLPALQRQRAALEERIEQGRAAQEALEEERERLAEIVQQLEEGVFAEETRAELERVLEEAEDLGYDGAAYRKAREEVEKGQRFAEQMVRLESARESVEEIRASLERLAEREKGLGAQIEELEKLRVELEEKADALRERLTDAEAVEEELQRVRAEEARARQQLGAAQQRLEACKALVGQREDKVQQLKRLEREESIYEELKGAFGVTGVPAMIIEAAVPEIEAEANQLLARMTQGRMHVRFDTQRETLEGNVRETLEIKISDEMGTREYSLYSGGEAFRVNFAIRIALSKLLARRAGAQLQTLVIDEGFGTQDAEGRRRLVEAINAIQDDFARILVITHIEELKDAFPARIEVTKMADGSVVQVM